MNTKNEVPAVGVSRADGRPGARPDDGHSQEPVAFEAAVTATGARPGDTAAKRELFTEETQTVLVFEKGAVIRLSAAVVDGQLLFLTNKSTKKEVVAQVMRKRAFRPTNCYVDLEFTEPCPGFWGIEFAKSASTPSAAGASVAKKLSADEDSNEKPGKPAAPPSAHEVERLKHEVAELQSQLKSLMNTASSPAPGASAAVTPPAELSGKKLENKKLLESKSDHKPPEARTPEEKKLEDKKLEALFAQEAAQEDAQEDALAPKRTVAYPKLAVEESAKKKGSNKLLTAAMVLLALAAGTFAAYRFGALDNVLKTAGISKPAPSSPAPNNPAPGNPAPSASVIPAMKPVAPAAKPAAQTPAPNIATDGTKAAPAPLLEEKNPVTTADAATVTTWKNNTSDPGKSAALASKSHARVASPAGSAKLSRSQPAEDSPAGSAASPDGGSDVAASSSDTADGVVAPKLISGHKSMAPPEMIKSYVTGNVKVDALVDATGHVRSVTVVSGPEKLRATAIEEMKQYRYQPARKNGKPIAAHVQVSLQFWYEP